MKMYNRLSLATLSCLFAVQVSHNAYASPWPTATPDSVTVDSNQRVNLPVLSNDIGTDLRLIEVNTVTVALGSVEMSEDKQTLYYTSATDYSGEDAFWYAFTDSEGRTNSAKVTVDVRAVGPEPVDPEPEPIDPVDPEPVDPEEPEPTDPSYIGWPTATTDVAETLVDQSVTIDVLGNDIGQSLEIIAVDAGTVSGPGIVDNRLKTAILEFRHFRCGCGQPKQAFGRHYDERPNDLLLDLTAEQMEILSRCRWVADLHIVFSTKL